MASTVRSMSAYKSNRSPARQARRARISSGLTRTSSAKDALAAANNSSNTQHGEHGRFGVESKIADRHLAHFAAWACRTLEQCHIEIVRRQPQSGRQAAYARPDNRNSAFNHNSNKKFDSQS